MTTPRGLQIGLLVLIAALATIESSSLALLTPIGEGADEWEHIDQALHWWTEKRLPDLAREDVGQAQHPPLAYLVQALVFAAATRAGLGEDLPPDRALDILGRRTALRPGHRALDDGPRTADEPARLRRRAETREAVFLAGRFVSVLLGLLAAILLTLALRAALPGEPGLAAAVTAFILLLPGWSAHFAYVSADPLLTMLACLASFLVLRARNAGRLGEWRAPVAAAFVLGFAFLTKIHALGIALFLGLVVLGDRRSAPRFTRRLALALVLAAGPLLVAGWWYLLRLREAGGLLTLEHHAALKPWLLRLQEHHPLAALDVIEELLRSFFGVVTAMNLAAPAFFFVLPTALATMALLGALLFRDRRAPDAPDSEAGGAKAGPGQPPRLALWPALAALLLLLAAILVANRHYHHVHGRYFLSLVVPLGLLLGRGLEGLCGRRAAALLAIGAAWNLVFLLFTVHVSVTGAMTVPAAKFTRGRVIAYRDCGHRFFDDRRAGGYEALRQYPWLRAPRHSIRATADDGLRYRFAIPDPSRALQVRILYPDASFRGQGELPIATAISLFADDVLIHGPLSIGLARGEQVHPLPREIQQDGEIVLRWENRAPGGFGVAVAEIWIEEAFVQAEGLFYEALPRRLHFDLVNIDPELATRPIFVAAADRDGEIATDLAANPIGLAARERRPVVLTLQREADPESLAVVLRDPLRGPLADLKLASFRTAAAKLSGRSDLPDLETILIGPESTPGPLAEGDLGLLPAGRFDLVISCSGDRRATAAGGGRDLDLRVETEGAVTPLAGPLERPDATGPLRFRLALGEAPASPVHLDRLRLEWPESAPGWGQRFPLRP